MAQRPIVGGRQAPQRAVGLAVRERHHVRPAVGRQGDAVRAVDVVGHQADRDRPIHSEALRAEGEMADRVGGLGGDDEAIDRRRVDGDADSDEKRGQGEAHQGIVEVHSAKCEMQSRADASG